MEWCARRGDNLNDTDFISHCLMDIAYQQKAIDIEKFKQWFIKWWESNEYLPLDVCLESIEWWQTDDA